MARAGAGGHLHTTRHELKSMITSATNTCACSCPCARVHKCPCSRACTCACTMCACGGAQVHAHAPELALIRARWHASKRARLCLETCALANARRHTNVSHACMHAHTQTCIIIKRLSLWTLNLIFPHQVRQDTAKRFDVLLIIHVDWKLA